LIMKKIFEFAFRDIVFEKAVKEYEEVFEWLEVSKVLLNLNSENMSSTDHLITLENLQDLIRKGKDLNFDLSTQIAPFLQKINQV